MLTQTIRPLSQEINADVALMGTYAQNAAAIARVLRAAGVECGITGPGAGGSVLVTVGGESVDLALTVLAKRRKDVEEDEELDDEEEEEDLEEDDDLDEDEDDEFDDEEEDEEDFEEEFGDDELDDDDDDIFYDEDEDE